MQYDVFPKLFARHWAIPSSGQELFLTLCKGVISGGPICSTGDQKRAVMRSPTCKANALLLVQRITGLIFGTASIARHKAGKNLCPIFIF